MRKNAIAILTLVAALAVFGAGIRVTDHLLTHQTDLAQWADTDTPPSLMHLMERPLEAQTNNFAGINKTFVAQTATGATSTTLFSSTARVPGVPINHTAELIVTGAPATCTYRLQGTSDNTTWFDISASAITCTSTTVAYEANKPAKNIRGNLVTLTGGTAPTVTLKYVGR